MTDELTCPECGERMYADEAWRVTDRSLIGTTVVGDLQGDYAHERCLE